MAVETTANYENIYQYDGNGWSDAVSIPGNDFTGANVFTSSSSFEETLNAVSFYTISGVVYEPPDLRLLWLGAL